MKIKSTVSTLIESLSKPRSNLLHSQPLKIPYTGVSWPSNVKTADAVLPIVVCTKRALAREIILVLHQLGIIIIKDPVGRHSRGNE